MSRPIDIKLARSLVPARPDDSHKGTYGHLLVIAGSVGLTGAACLACEAAFRTGVGMVTLGLPKSLNLAMEARLTETMTRPLPETAAQSLGIEAFDEIARMSEGMDGIALGPGLSTDPETQELIRKLVGELDLPMVIDADGLNALAGHTDVLISRKGPAVISPHPGEMSRLTGLSTSEVQQKREMIAPVCASDWGVDIIMKGAPSLVATTGGRLFENTTGNSGMSTAGSGDVLTGMVAALLCQGLGTAEAAVLGTYLHGLAGNEAAGRYTGRGMVASDMIECLPEAWHTLD
jgi:NAD(P)H-hydrate epimerase